MFIDYFLATGVVTMGGCFPTSTCISDCTQLYSNQLSQSLPFTTQLEQCKMSCCDTDLCNDVDEEDESVTPGKPTILINSAQIKSFIILAVLRRSV